MIQDAWALLKETAEDFLADDALSRGAAMAFYCATSLAPILLIVVAIAGLAFGHDAAQDALSAQLSGLMGKQAADMLQAAIAGAASKPTGIFATVAGIVMLLVTASGVFGEMQSSLNAIWKVKPLGGSLSRILRARAASLGLVGALGFLLIVSLVMSAGISALADFINARIPFGTLLLSFVNVLISWSLISLLFAAIYKVLPDRRLEWRDVWVGAAVTGGLFTIGKGLIGWYVGNSATASSYGAAGALLVVLLWVYYSSQIFLLGAEFTHVFSLRLGSRRDALGPGAEESNQPLGVPAPTGVASTDPFWSGVAAALTGVAVLKLLRRVF